MLQVTAAGMEPAALDREFGQHLTFYGGVNTQQTLPLGSVQDVRRKVGNALTYWAGTGAISWRACIS